MNLEQTESAVFLSKIYVATFTQGLSDFSSDCSESLCIYVAMCALTAPFVLLQHAELVGLPNSTMRYRTIYCIASNSA